MSEPGKTKPGHYLLAGLILLVGVGVSLFLLSRPDAGPVQDPDSSEQARTEHTVRFYDLDGQLLQTETVLTGQAVLPPELHRTDLRFRGWDKPLHCVTEDMDVYPEVQPLGEEKNIVCTDAVYADTGQEFCIIPRLAGTVDCSQFSIEIAYDKDLLKFQQDEAVLVGVQVENDKGGLLTLRWSGEETLTQPMQLTKLYFTCRQTGAFETNFPTATKEIHTLQNGAQVYTDSMAYDGALFLSTAEKE